MLNDLFCDSDALVSLCSKYRYWLTRRWDFEAPMIVWVMLNPSTADADSDDPTIRRCIGFSDSWGFGQIRVVNLYAYQATDPAELLRTDDPIGPDNDEHLISACRDKPVVVAWGSHAKKSRADRVLSMITPAAESVDCLGLTKGGYPKHPLFLRKDTSLVPYE